MSTSLITRAQGCLVGLCVGDALGAQVEFSSAATIARRFPDGVRIVTGGGPFDLVVGQVTDDSELGLALARSLADHGQCLEAEVARAYVDWIRSSPFDIGGTIGRALRAGAAAVDRGEDPAAACKQAASRESEANGALMRIAPLAIFGHSMPIDDLVELARTDARLTHSSTPCMDANAIFVVALASAIRGTSAKEIYEAALQLAAHLDAAPQVRQALAGASTRPPEGCDGPKAGWVVLALQAAFHALLHASSFEEAVVETVGRGGDTDTTAAITGALIGAVEGLEGIPRAWREAVLRCRPERGRPDVRNPRPMYYWPHDALDLAERLTTLADPDGANHRGAP